MFLNLSRLLQHPSSFFRKNSPILCEPISTRFDWSSSNLLSSKILLLINKLENIVTKMTARSTIYYETDCTFSKPTCSFIYPFLAQNLVRTLSTKPPSGIKWPSTDLIVLTVLVSLEHYMRCYRGVFRYRCYSPGFSINFLGTHFSKPNKRRKELFPSTKHSHKWHPISVTKDLINATCITTTIFCIRTTRPDRVRCVIISLSYNCWRMVQ